MEQRADEALKAAKAAGSEELRLDTMILMGLKAPLLRRVGDRATNN